MAESGRPKKLTEKLIVAVCDVILAGNFRCVAGRMFGVSPRTFRRWMAMGKRFPEGLYGKFRRCVLESESVAEVRAVGDITRAGKTDVEHLKWWLERKYPQRWGRYRGELGEIKRKLKELEKLAGEMRGEIETDPDREPK